MKSRILALGIVGIVVSSYAIAVKSTDKLTDWKDYGIKAGFIFLLIFSLGACIYILISHFRRKRYNGIRTIRQYYLQRGTR
ncbi:hypothetical protein [uncultured Flavobacterium sp.]|uniref:hypothetical protein n=1 Tax=uncultured Flavobacterium sp. TaxID=165435 RepID=UPI0025EE3A6A|nr:hypothetical protein [uncultured Flavobacterium sp.]